MAAAQEHLQLVAPQNYPQLAQYFGLIKARLEQEHTHRRLLSSEEYHNAYCVVYDLAGSGNRDEALEHSAQLYRLQREELTAYAQSQLNDLYPKQVCTEAEAFEFLDRLAVAWVKCQRFIKVVWHIFQYLDRYFVTHNNLLSVRQAAMCAVREVFRTQVETLRTAGSLASTKLSSSRLFALCETFQELDYDVVISFATMISHRPSKDSADDSTKLKVLAIISRVNEATISAASVFQESVMAAKNFETALQLVNPQVAKAIYRYKRYPSYEEEKASSLVFLIDHAPTAPTNRHRSSLRLDESAAEQRPTLITSFSKVFLALLQAGADVNAATDAKRTPLHTAASLNLTDVIEKLIEFGADVNAKDGKGRTPIFEACRGCAYEAFELLRQAKGVHFNVNETDEDKATMLHLVCSPPNIAHVIPPEGVKILEYLVEHGANVNATSNIGRTPLHSSASIGSIEAMRLLLSHGAGIHVADEKRSTPLHFAAGFGKLQAVELLLESGADLSIRNKEGATALELAINKRHYEVATFIRNFATSRRASFDPTLTLGMEETAPRKVQNELWNTRARQAVAFMKLHQPMAGPDFETFVQCSFETWGFAGFAQTLKEKFGDHTLPPAWKPQLESGADVGTPPAWWRYASRS